MQQNTFPKRGPAPEQPGTLRQQLAAIDHYLRLPSYFRRRDKAGAWHIARWHELPHVRLYDQGAK